MKVERKQWGDVTILTFVGEFDAFNLPNFSSKIDNLIESGNLNLVFNLRLLKFINSSALGYLVKTKKLVAEKGGDLVVVQPSKFVKKALTVLGLHEFFKIFETDQEGVLYYHKGEDVDSIKLDQMEAEPDEKLLGENAIMFRLMDDDGHEILGPTPYVGKITSLYENGLLYRYPVSAPGGRWPLNSENFDEHMTPGRTLKVKFRQPFVAKTKYFDATCSVMKAATEEEDGETVATVHLEYTDIAPEDKAALDQFTKDLEGFRKEVK